MKNILKHTRVIMITASIVPQCKAQTSLDIYPSSSSAVIAHAKDTGHFSNMTDKQTLERGAILWRAMKHCWVRNIGKDGNVTDTA
jgi:hypothetical protein